VCCYVDKGPHGSGEKWRNKKSKYVFYCFFEFVVYVCSSLFPRRGGWKVMGGCGVIGMCVD